MYKTGILATVLNGQLLGEDLPVTYLSADSRKIAFPEQTLFFALVTTRRNGHYFIGEAYRQGVRSFVISEHPEIEFYPDASFIKVHDTLTALQGLAAWHRSQFHIPVIGITGSNGKTIVKEWLNQLLHLNEKNRVVRSPKSFNSQIGVPLSVWQINKSHSVGIFEAGISKPGEMPALQEIIQPTIGILTNIGAAHDEGFASRRQKLDEKLLLFKNVTTLICCYDDPLIREAATALPVKKFSWGQAHDCHLQLLEVTQSSSGVLITLKQDETEMTFELAFTDAASIENALHCIALMLYSGINTIGIAERLKQLQPVEMRLEWKKGTNNCYLINDSYSNDISSFIIALDYLEQQQQGNRRTVILSDFYESGLSDDELYTTVAGLLKQHNINRLFSVGSHIGQFTSLFEQQGIAVQNFSNTGTLIEAVDQTDFINEIVLLKGARRFGFERIVSLLEQQVHQTVLEINLTALAANLQQYRQLLAPPTKIMVMVKAFGYGSGDAEVAKVLQFNKVDYLAVAYTDEGVSLRKSGVTLPVMVMNPEPASFENIENYNLEPEIFSFEILAAFQNFCEAQGISHYPVHIKLDTGMHRLGFEPDDVPGLAIALAAGGPLVVKSVFTHLAASGEPVHDAFTAQQAAKFIEACTLLQKSLPYPFIRHAANTAAIRRHPDKHFDMVRLGVGLYGVDEQMPGLQVVSTMKTTVAQVKLVAPGETVGYSRRGMVTRPSKIATVRIGYADGYSRQLGNGVGKMIIRNKTAPVIGNVCMDMTMLDVTDLGEVKPGDIVEVFGAGMPVQQLARQCGTISYEIMTGVGQRVKRVYLQE